MDGLNQKMTATESCIQRQCHMTNLKGQGHIKVPCFVTLCAPGLLLFKRLALIQAELLLQYNRPWLIKRQWETIAHCVVMVSFSLISISFATIQLKSWNTKTMVSVFICWEWGCKCKHKIPVIQLIIPEGQMRVEMLIGGSTWWFWFWSVSDLHDSL